MIKTFLHYVRGRIIRKTADAFFFSSPCSGRTWVRVFLGNYYMKKNEWGTPATEFTSLRIPRRLLPRILFKHKFGGRRDAPRDLRNKKVILLVRDPRDTAISTYYDRKNRLGHSLPDIDTYVQQYVPEVIHFINTWVNPRLKCGSLLILRYEDIHAYPGEEFSRLLKFLGETPVDKKAFEYALQQSTLSKMKKDSKETTNPRLTPSDAKNPDSYKARRGKVGSYKQELGTKTNKNNNAALERLPETLGYNPE